MLSAKSSFGLILSVLVLVGVANCQNNSFPGTFAWGVASAAYQIEGAWNADDKGQSIWDWFSHLGGTVNLNQTGDVADDFYHKYLDDIDMMSQLGIKHFRMSLSWPRLLPNGTVNLTTMAGSSQEGVDFYNRVFAALEAAGITPWVTLYHWDLPAVFAANTSSGGWLDSNMPGYFRDYAEFCFITFGDTVKHWLTFNEISTYSFQGYGTGNHAPGRCSDPKCVRTGGGGDTSGEPYIVTHNSLLAHGAAVAVYRSKYWTVQQGVIGLTINSGFSLPWDPSDPQDADAAERSLQFNFGWFANPIIKGDYPDIMKQLVKARLPIFNATEQTILAGSYDFIGINYYTSNFARHTDVPGNNWGNDAQAVGNITDVYGNLIGPTAQSSWLQVYPEGLGKLINWVVETYNVNSTKTPFYIFENGVSVPGENDMTIQDARNDAFRVSYLRDHLSVLVQTMLRDNVNIQGYFSWSIIDNFEWSDGYSVRFGMVYVDYNQTATLPRYPKSSAYWYKGVIGNLTGGEDLDSSLDILSAAAPFINTTLSTEGIVV